MESTEMVRRFAAAPVAGLASIGPSGPHLVPVCFALVGEATVYSAVDWKPKSGRPLRRLLNLAADPRCSLLVDEYAEDWDRLWWIRADGLARVHEPGGSPPEAVAALQEKYAQYRLRPPEGPVVEITVRRWSHWSGRG